MQPLGQFIAAGPQPEPGVPLELFLLLMVFVCAIGWLLGMMWERGKWFGAADGSRWHESGGRMYRVERQEDRARRIVDEYFETEEAGK